MRIQDVLPYTNSWREESERTREYNYIAWVFGDTSRRWWPVEGYYWPLPKPDREESIDDFISAFSLHGYEVCDDGTFESGFEKIAIYTINGEPTHAAKQKANGLWSSKIGSLEDIEHENPEDVNCPTYGTVHTFMRRRLS